MAPIEGYVYVDNKSVTIDTGVEFAQQSHFSADSDGYATYGEKRFYYNGALVRGVDTPIQNANYFTINDLTGTKWVINENPTVDGDIVYSINFTSNNSIWSEFEFSTGNDPVIKYDFQTSVYNGDSGIWTSQAYRLISITGGTDAQNSTLISWLLSNATQVPVVDLTGTEWLFNDIIGISSDIEWFINFTSNANSHTGIGLEEHHVEMFYFTDYPVYTTAYSEDLWDDNAYKTISITSGTDVANPDLIAWLSQNATIQESSSPSISIGTLSLSSVYCNGDIAKIILNGVTLYEKIFYPITVTLTNATASQSNPSIIAEDGTATLIYTFDGTNYICPTTSPTVTGATGVWTKDSDTQGTMVLSNATGNVSFTVAGEQALPQLDTPTNLSVSDTTASFDEVENAEFYEFYVDDESIGTYTVYDASQVGTELTIENAPASQSGNEVTIE